MIQDILVQIVFGWPAIITSLLVSLAGVWLKKPYMLVLGGVVLLPFTFYLSGYRSPAAILPLFQFGAAYAVAKNKTVLAWVLLAPLVITIILLAYAVLSQTR